MKIVNNLPKHDSRVIHIFSTFIFFSIAYVIFFSPVIFSERLLAPGDGINYSVPAFYSMRTLWTNLILSGFPVAADPQVQTWYFISFIFSLIPNSWNIYIVSAYVLASCFTYGYVYTITNSKLAATFSGIVYGMSGFMMAHLGHTMMIHTAAWMPLIIWALEKLRHSFSVKWVAVGCLGIASSIFAGHPQIAVYSAGLSGVYALVVGWTAPIGKWNYYKSSLAVLVMGIGLSAIQLIPTAELSTLGLRVDMSFQEFNSYSLSPGESIQLLFPYFFGGKPLWPFNTPYFGTWGLTETTGYVGFLPFMLAIVGLLSYQNKSISRFWGFTALVTFLLTLGNNIPLAWVMYHIPVFNKFRVPARHFLEMTLAFSVLSGLGVAAIKRQLVNNILLKKIVLLATGLVIIVFTLILVSQRVIFTRIQEVAGIEEVKKFTLIPWSNPAIGIPVLVFLISASILIYWSKSPSSKIPKFLILLALLLDLGSFGWFYEWQYSSPSKSLLTPTVATQKYKDILNSSQQRMLPIRGGIGVWDEIPVNMSRLWGVPSASGYGPLILSRLSKLLSMATSGVVSLNQSSPLEAQQSMDIMSIRYVFVPKNSLSVYSVKGVNWSTENMSTSLGSGCGNQHPNSVNFLVPSGESISNVTAIGLVSSLNCSTDIANDTEVLQVRLTDSSGKVATQSLRAGSDTSEWAYDCSDVQPFMRHNRAQFFESYSVERKGFPKCQGHKYFSILPVNELGKVKSVELNWIGKSGGIDLQKISLINDKAKQYYPITANNSLFADTKHWQYVEDINQASVYENLQAMQRVWLVPEVTSIKPEEVLSAIQTSKLPDGKKYEPSETALVEENIEFKTQNFDSAFTTKFVKSEDTHIQLQTSSKSPSFLVLSDIYYPGWKAKIDGKNTHIFQTNYVQRGVLLPEGNHVVDFEFKPTSFHIGLGISLSSLGLLGYLFIKKSHRQKLQNI